MAKNIFKDYKTLTLILIIFSLGLLAFGCTSTNDTEKTEIKINLPDPVQEAVDTVQENIQPQAAPPSYDEDVQDLLEKSAKISSYHYSFTGNKLNSFGTYDSLDNYEIMAKGELIKKTYSIPVKLGSSLFYSELYLNIEEKTAFVTCDLRTVLCDDDRQKIRSVPYSDVKPELNPLQLLDDLPADVKIKGTETISSRKATIIHFQRNGKEERISIDSYSGFPLKQEIYSIEEEPERLITNAFKLKSFNNLKRSELLFPTDYEAVE